MEERKECNRASKRKNSQKDRGEGTQDRKYKEENFASCSFSLSRGEIPLMSQILTCGFFCYGQGSLYGVLLAYLPPAEHCSEN